jgi:hypothetical protein
MLGFEGVCPKPISTCDVVDLESIKVKDCFHGLFTVPDEKPSNEWQFDALLTKTMVPISQVMCARYGMKYHASSPIRPVHCLKIRGDVKHVCSDRVLEFQLEKGEGAVSGLEHEGKYPVIKEIKTGKNNALGFKSNYDTAGNPLLAEVYCEALKSDHVMKDPKLFASLWQLLTYMCTYEAPLGELYWGHCFLFAALTFPSGKGAMPTAEITVLDQMRTEPTFYEAHDYLYSLAAGLKGCVHASILPHPQPVLPAPVSSAGERKCSFIATSGLGP